MSKVNQSAKTYEGSCLCGGVKFEIDGRFESFYLCHCRYCQKDTGSAHAANLFAGGAKLKWLSGEELVRTFLLPSTRHAKSFCEVCGSALPKYQSDGKTLAVPAGSLDTSIAMRPTAHIYVSSRPAWDDDLESLKKFDRLPTE